jgi:glutamate dehydrogenase (NAD(P)+)
MEDAFRFADDLGPFKIIQMYRPWVGLKAVVAIDNVACGPAIGGVRWRPMSAPRKPSDWREQ